MPVFLFTSKEMRVHFRFRMHFHFLSKMLDFRSSGTSNSYTYHFEGVQLFFDLLGQHRRQTIAGGDFSAPIVFSTWPSIVEYNPGAERNVSRYASRRSWCALLIATRIVLQRQEIIVSLNVNRVGSSVSPSRWVLVDRRAGRRRPW